jgi:hypothetical protein
VAARETGASVAPAVLRSAARPGAAAADDPGCDRMQRMTSYVLDATLAHIRPRIGRQLRVPGDLSLAGLHQALQIAFGWQDSHVHEFHVGRARYGVSDPEGGDDKLLDDADIAVAAALPFKTSTMQYIYDLGDCWMHTVTVDGIDAEQPKRSPRSLRARGPTAPAACLAGERACPPEDCGGPPGYADFLEAIHTSGHPQHAELLEWVGGEFDAEWFSLSDVNRELSALS